MDSCQPNNTLKDKKKEEVEEEEKEEEEEEKEEEEEEEEAMCSTITSARLALKCSSLMSLV